MSMAMLSDQTIIEFIRDTEAFDQCIDQQFALLDVDGDGVLSRNEVCTEYDGRVFERFDEDKDGSFDHEEFRSFFKEMMLAMARGIGCMPILMALEHGSMLMCAVQHELTQRNKSLQADAAHEIQHQTKKKERKPRLHGLYMCFCGELPPRDDSQR